MTYMKAVTGIVSLIVAAYVISQIHIPAAITMVQNSTALATSTTVSSNSNGLAGLVMTAFGLSAAGAVAAKIKGLF